MSEISASEPTGGSPDRRKLIAVVHMDMVGYSRLIGLDDAGTLQRLRMSTITLFDGMAITEFDVLPASASHRL
jgi:hypothetical protein